MVTCLALDFGGSSVKHALVDEDATVRERGSVPAPLDSPEQFVSCVRDLYDRYGSGIDGIAISMAGPIDTESGVLLNSGAYTALYNRNILQLLADELPVAIALENDGKCGALAEAWNGRLAEQRDGAVILLGTAIGGGIVQNGRVLHGRGFAAGEFSHLIVDAFDRSVLGVAGVACGMVGLTYKLCKAKNLDLSVQDARPLLEHIDSLVSDRFLTHNAPPARLKVDGKQFFQWLADSDPDAQRIYADFIASLAALAQNIQSVVAPTVIAIGGGLTNAPRVISDLSAALADYYERTQTPSELQAVIVPCAHRGEGNVVGATYNFLSRHVW